MKTPIPKEIAEEICEEMQEYYSDKKFLYWKFFCYFCRGRCFGANEFNRGCKLINRTYDKKYKNS